MPEIISCQSFRPSDLKIIPFGDLPQSGRLETEIYVPVWALISAVKMVPISHYDEEGNRWAKHFTMSVKENGRVLSIAFEVVSGRNAGNCGSNQIQARVVGKAQEITLCAGYLLPYLRSADEDKGLLICVYEADPYGEHFHPIDFRNGENYRYLQMQVSPKEFPQDRIQRLERRVAELQKIIGSAKGGLNGKS